MCVYTGRLLKSIGELHMCTGGLVARLGRPHIILGESIEMLVECALSELKVYLEYKLWVELVSTSKQLAPPQSHIKVKPAVKG